MCTQTVSLVQAELEARGITTVSLTQMLSVTQKIAPPRALYVPWRFGFSMGEAHDAALQGRVVEQALALTARDDVPLLEKFVP